MPDDPPSLEEVTQVVFATRQELTDRITEALVEQRHARMLQQRIVACPHCQRLLPARPPLRARSARSPRSAPPSTAFTLSRGSLPGMKPSSFLSAASHGT